MSALTWEGWFSLGVVAMCFVMFAWGRGAPDIVTSAALTLLLLFGVVGIADADLTLFSPQIVLDDRGTPGPSDDLFFFRDLARFGDMTYAEQLTSIAALNTELSGLGPWQDN